MILFQKNGMTDLVLDLNVSFIFTPSYEPNQIRTLTENNKPVVVKRGEPLRIIDLELRNLTYEEVYGVNGIINWFDSSTVDFSMSNFTIVLENNESYIVRFWDNNMSVKRNGYNNYTAKLKLLIE